MVLAGLKESMDGAPAVKGVMGALLWMGETYKQFQSNKSEWQEFAGFVTSLRAAIENATTRSSGHKPSPSLDSDVRMLIQPLNDIASELMEMHQRYKTAKVAQTREDPKKIVQLRTRLQSALHIFQASKSISIEQKVERIDHNVRFMAENYKASIGSKTRPPHALKACPLPTAFFRGRRDVLDQMRKHFKNRTGKLLIFVLYGLGGAGKSQIAYKFVEESQSSKQAMFPEIFHLDATTRKGLEKDLENIASAKNVDNTAQDAISYLERTKQEWLLVFNNADDTYDRINSYFPRASHRNILGLVWQPPNFARSSKSPAKM